MKKAATRPKGANKSHIKRQRRNFRLFALAVLVLLVFTSVSAYAVQSSKQPPGVLKLALAKTLQAESARVSLFVEKNVESEKSPTFDFSGVVSASGKFDVVGKYSAENGQSLGVALRSVDGKDAYLRLSGVNRLRSILGENAADYGITEQRNPLAGLDSKWLAIPANLKDTVLQNRPADGKNSYNLSATDQLKAAGLYRRHEFLRVSKAFPDSNVDGVTAHHYRVTVKPDELREFLRAIKRDIVHLQLTDVQVDAMVESAEKIRNLQVWIGKDDKMIHRLQFDQLQENGRSNVVLRLQDINGKVQIEKPADAVPLFEALTNLVAGDAAKRINR